MNSRTANWCTEHKNGDDNNIPGPSANILDLAKRAAEGRYRELREEIASLMPQFPQLRTLTARNHRAAASNNSNAAVAENGEGEGV